MIMTLRLLKNMRPVASTNRAGAGDTLDAAFRVLPSDLDVLRHMNNGRYLSILDAARMAYHVRTGLWPRLRSAGWHPVVAAQTITYRRSLTLGTRFVVRTTLLGFDAKNAIFEQNFVVGDSVHATALVACRYLDGTGKSVSPSDLRTLDVRWTAADSLDGWVTDWTESVRAHATDASSRAME